MKLNQSNFQLQSAVHPKLVPVWTLSLLASIAVFAACFQGYGCWFRTFFAIAGGVLVVGTNAVLLMIGHVWWKYWVRASESKVPEHGASLRAIVAVGLVAPLILCLSAYMVGSFARYAVVKAKVADFSRIMDDLDAFQKLNGSFPRDARELTSIQKLLDEGVMIYFGESSSNGDEGALVWEVNELALCELSVLSATDYFELIVPVERICPISFSAFYVLRYTSDSRLWAKEKVHWTYGEAYIN